MSANKVSKLVCTSTFECQSCHLQVPVLSESQVYMFLLAGENAAACSLSLLLSDPKEETVMSHAYKFDDLLHGNFRSFRVIHYCGDFNEQRVFSIVRVINEEFGRSVIWGFPQPSDCMVKSLTVKSLTSYMFPLVPTVPCSLVLHRRAVPEHAQFVSMPQRTREPAILARDAVERQAVSDEVSLTCAVGLCTEPCTRHVDSRRIVLLGAGSLTAQSFLYELFQQRGSEGRKRSFPNLVLIDEKSIDEKTRWFTETPGDRNMKASIFGASRYVSASANSCKMISSRAISIDRAARVVRTSDNQEIPYDLLLLTPGMREGSLQTIGMNGQAFSTHLSGAISAPDTNALIELYDPESAIGKSVRFNPAMNTVVYGASLVGLSVVWQLLLTGVPSSRIYIVNTSNVAPGKDEVKAPTLCDSLMAPTIECLKTMGVHYMPNSEGVTLVGVEKDNYVNRVQGAVFRSNSYDPFSEWSPFEYHALERGYLVPCRAIITADKYSVDLEMFRILMDQGIVFDGRVVVDEQMRTSDPNIYCAGPVAEFSRKYSWAFPHSDGSSVDCGKALCEALFAKPAKFTLDTAHVVSYILPGGLRYVSARTCMPQTIDGATQIENSQSVSTRAEVTTNSLRLISDSEHDSTSSSSTSRVSTFRSVVWQGNYFSIEYTKLAGASSQVSDGLITSVTYAGMEGLYECNLARLVGKPIALLNNLVHRVESKEVTDILSFLSQGWADPLFAPDFSWSNDSHSQMNRFLRGKGVRLPECQTE